MGQHKHNPNCEKYKGSEQSEPNGNCSECRRKDYCNKTCSARHAQLMLAVNIKMDQLMAPVYGAIGAMGVGRHYR